MSDPDNPLNYILLDVFSDHLFGGNQLAVFPNGEGLSVQAMAAIALELKLNETVFITGRSIDGYSARIFSPHGELPFAGHPVIGAAYAMATLNKDNAHAREFRFDLPAGLVPIKLGGTVANPKPMLQSPYQPVPLVLDIKEHQLGQIFGLKRGDFAQNGWTAEAYSSGIPFLCVPLASKAAVTKAKLATDMWRTQLSKSVAPHMYIFALEGDDTVHARMFAPAVGIDEDPATGAAAIALGGYLAKNTNGQSVEGNFKIFQGVDMGRPSCIDLKILSDEQKLEAVWIGGHCTFFGSGTLSPQAAITDVSQTKGDTNEH